MKRFSDRLYDALRSVKLAAALIVLIALLAAAGGIVPQGRMEQFYLQKFPGTPARVILSLGLDDVFGGIPFLALVALFTVNLTVCSFHRFTGEFKKPRANRRHGPDILHIGLLVFILGGILSVRTRTEALLYLGAGDSAELPDGSRIVLVDLKEERYPDGRAKSWESLVFIEESAGAGGLTATADPSTAIEPPADPAAVRRIKVNSPLRHKGYTLYQQDWKSECRAVLEDWAGIRLSLEPGERVQMQDGFAMLMAVDKREPAGAEMDAPSNYEAIFLVESGSGREVIKPRAGDEIGPFAFVGFEEEAVSGLKLVRDRGYSLVAAGLVLVLLGAFLTYYRTLQGMFA